MGRKTEHTESNYEKQVYIARDIFLKFDQEEIIRKFHLESDEEWIYLRLLDRMYRISRKDGEISYRGIHQYEAAGESAGNVQKAAAEQTECGNDTEQKMTADKTECCSDMLQECEDKEYTVCLDFNVVMTIYDALCHSKTTPALSYQWCPVQELQVTMSSPGTDKFTGKYAKLFSGRAEKLLDACRKLGGEQPALRASADVAWQFSVFPFFPVQMRFWDGDDEFEPKIQLLWDKNTLTFMHFETTYYLQGYLMQRLEELVTVHRQAERQKGKV